MKNRVLMVSCNGLGRGGVQSVIMSIVRNLTSDYIFDILLFTEKKREYEEEFLSYGGNIYRIPFYEGTNKLLSRVDIYLRWNVLYKRAKKIMECNGPYVAIHCHNNFESAFMLKAAKEIGISLRIVHSHSPNNDTENIGLFRQLYNKYTRRLMLKKANVLIACSEIAGKVLFGTDVKFTIINNTYNGELFDKKKYENKVFDCPMLIQVGSYSSNKNQLFTADVFKELLRVYPDAELSYVGFDTFEKYEIKLKKYIESLQIEDKVCFYPCDADIPYLMSQANLLIFPSVCESFGIVLIEGQAMGLRCYASSAVPKSANMGGCVYLPLDKGTKYWAEKIVQDYKLSGANKMEYDCSTFLVEEVMSQYLHLYGRSGVCGKI